MWSTHIQWILEWHWKKRKICLFSRFYVLKCTPNFVPSPQIDISPIYYSPHCRFRLLRCVWIPVASLESLGQKCGGHVLQVNKTTTKEKHSTPPSCSCGVIQASKRRVAAFVYAHVFPEVVVHRQRERREEESRLCEVISNATAHKKSSSGWSHVHVSG